MDLPDADALRWIVTTYARLRADHGAAIGAPELVLPTGEFFPDAFRPDAPSVARLLRRMIGYAPIAEDLGVELAFVAPADDHAGGCGSAACGSGGARGPAGRDVEELADGYRVFVAAMAVASPVLLTTSLARSVGALVLHEAGEELGDDAAVTSEVAATACGLGVLVAGGSAVWAKSCGGLRMTQATALTVEESAVALALFLALHGVKASRASAHLEATQAEALDLALAWTESNPLIVEALRDRPELLAAGAFDLEPVRGLVGRWLHKRKVDKELRAQAPAPAAPLSDDKRRRIEEARALVDEVLGGD
jgi:hypothetical protein